MGEIIILVNLLLMVHRGIEDNYGKRYLSDSKCQREAEELIFENLKSKLKCNDLQSNVSIRISKENNIWICSDFYSEKKHNRLDPYPS